MSNFLAVATVTATLRRLLLEAAAHDVSGARVTMVRPDTLEGAVREPSVNVYLYQVSPNAGWRNADLPTRRADGQLVCRPRAALDLHYLLTFYGDDEQLEPQRLLGSVVRTLHGQPVLTRDNIEGTLPTLDVLENSDLAREVELVKFTPIAFSLEELSKLWSVFFQTPYTLSMAYQGTVVFIEGAEPTSSPMPVLRRDVTAWPMSRPLIESVGTDADPPAPITADRDLVIRGQRLRGPITTVMVDDVEVESAEFTRLTDRAIALPVPSVLRAGLHAVHVVHDLPLGDPPVPHHLIESNTSTFVLRPKLAPDASGDYVTADLAADANELMSGSVTVLHVDPTIGAGQPVSLLLNHDTRGELTYRFSAVPLDQDGDAITIPVTALEQGRYFVRLQVGRAESPLEVQRTVDAGGTPHDRIIGPTLEVVA